jgi:hypothetical protein
VILDKEYLDFLLTTQRYFSRFDDATRIMKVSEEVGEANEAYLRFSHRNPWKDSVSAYDLAMELGDVVMAALIAIVHFGFNPDDVLRDQRSKMERRIHDNPT